MARNLDTAKLSKKDEFYTQLSDIERELEHYKNHLINNFNLADDRFQYKFYCRIYNNFCVLKVVILRKICYT